MLDKDKLLEIMAYLAAEGELLGYKESSLLKKAAELMGDAWKCVYLHTKHNV